ncbi:hypothetical protein E3J74_08455 [Candidatus Bathyarchaeota archaeon]|nr:MAG: hypothetical protein E3J74_08455 [Candidatus Bathyarchaeota archaeon]
MIEMNKHALTSFTILCLLSTVFLMELVMNIQIVEAVIDIVYIRADGSVDPPSPAISTIDNVTYTFAGNIAGRVVIQRDNIIIDGSGHTLSWIGTGVGMNLTSVSNVTIKNMEIEGFQYGIRLEQSSNNNVFGSNIKDNWCGIWIQNSLNNIISEDTVESNTYGVWIWASNNTLSENIIANSSISGIVIDADSSDNTLSGNEIMNNARGIWVISASDNRFYHNSFIENTQQVHISMSVYANVWDDGYPSGGNYWSDYAGVDLYSGASQNETGSDGIGDNPYFMDVHNQDNYPLMTPITPLYYELLEAYNALLADYQDLNSTYHELLNDYSELQSNYDSLNLAYYELAQNHTLLQNSFDSLTTSYNELQEQYSSLNSTYNELQLEQEPIMNELNNVRNLMYIFITTTIILIAITVYFATRKPKT